ncbi:hypothetical protein GCM10007301_06410 [Azorhizobium oxalatiphilum]|uniref:Tetratricopeptide repeat protein n=1 Tax=Azorhizobium oxalatiphilum TaxID=980631 RepID=A0A917BPW4_9HYPH|nr:hypothetical protein [Azorhizobium oxalatiphilum]GGF49867.1 hypothetical protein GCM10007301_06410 [Azorhizobium oxalatiphilum]
MPLALPAAAGDLALDRDQRYVAYMPFGFVSFQDWQLGNGDQFGLYWPIGREGGAPIVAETFHDDGSVMPGFSGIDSFLAATRDLDEADHPGFPTLADDPRSPLALYEEARRLLKAQRVEDAIHRLEAAIAVLPEYTSALALLASQYLRLGGMDAACRMAVRATISPPSFGCEAHVSRMKAWLAQQEHAPEDLRDDPVWLHRRALEPLPSGGQKESPAYGVALKVIAAYEARGEIVPALTLMQSYGEYMGSETSAFWERNGFSPTEHRARQVELSARLPHGPRVLV